MHRHRPNSGLKQSNKNHKAGKHASKSQLKRKTAGKIEGVERVGLKESGKGMSKIDRKRKGKQLAQTKKESILFAKRTGHRVSSKQLGTAGAPPKIVGIVLLNNNIDTNSIIDLISSQSDYQSKNSTFPFPLTLHFPTWKQRVSFFLASRRMESVLDTAKVADLLLLVIPSEGIDPLGESFLSGIKAQGVPTVMGILQGTNSLPSKDVKPKRKELTQFFQSHFGNDTKVLPLDTEEDSVQATRFVSQNKLNPIVWRERRPYLLAENLQFLPSSTEGVGTLVATGFLRGENLDVNRLVHLPTLGDFQLEKVEGPADPHRRNAIDTDSPVVLATPTPELQDSLQAENEPDAFAADQTWPDENELQEAKEREKILKGKQKKKRVPKGTSIYQAAWIIESDDDEEGDSSDDEEEMDDVEDDQPTGEATMESDAIETESVADDGEEWVDLEAIEREGRQAKMDAKASKSAKSEKSEEDKLWPDEVETPLDEKARIRFQKYRGLKSFRSSPWDPKENLPSEYSRIFQFENFERAKKRATTPDPAAIPSGTYISLHISNVPSTVLNLYPAGSPCVIGGLLKYENQISVVNFSLMKHPSYSDPVESKEPLIFNCGFRRYKTLPIFSEHNVRCDKQKYERFLHPGRGLVASIYAPITFPPATLLVLKEQEGELKLAATGSVMNVDPDRVVLKKIVLTGIPYKVHKKKVVVRDMFYDPDDIRWFKPVELWTKLGRVGHIKEPVGTHGYMKCVLDGQLSYQDTVCMSLYKRVFPVWTRDLNLESNQMDSKQMDSS